MGKKIGDVIKVGTNLMELIEFIIYKPDRSDAGQYKCHYGINVFKVREVIKMPEVIPLPESIPYIEGMFNLRNENIPLLNLAERLGGVEKSLNDNIVIVAEFNNIYIGLIVHDVVQIHRISWEKILPPPKMASGTETELIIGVIQLSETNSLVILDFEKIVNEINPSTDETINSFISDTDYEGLSVLLADDSRLVRQQMQKFLTKLGLNVTLVNNGAEAFDYLSAQRNIALEKDIDIRELIFLVITDIEMPQMDGYTLTHKIKNDEVLSSIPVVMHTSLSGDNVKVKGQEVGADAYITKFNVESIKETLKLVMHKFPILK